MVQLGDIAFVLKFFARNLITVNTQRAQKMRMARWMHKMGKNVTLKILFTESEAHGLFSMVCVGPGFSLYAKYLFMRIYGPVNSKSTDSGPMVSPWDAAWLGSALFARCPCMDNAEWTVQKVMCSPCVPLMGRGNMRRLLEVCMFNIVPPGCTDWHGCTAKFWVKCLNTISLSKVHTMSKLRNILTDFKTQH